MLCDLAPDYLSELVSFSIPLAHSTLALLAPLVLLIHLTSGSLHLQFLLPETHSPQMSSHWGMLPQSTLTHHHIKNSVLADSPYPVPASFFFLKLIITWHTCLFFVCSPQPVNENEGFVWSRAVSQYLDQCPVCSRCSMRIVWVDEQRQQCREQRELKV